ncbi:hypothetical protein KZZ52_44475 [Dactylosporangium sp. AC04546]|uniref:hypothetical protein n=1 Tax=Dactylosporangium sp. AC04546 TaxID=2862460 RepID=UPI001EDC95D3|nr:hypothetical protein [Dactylosporangium sp. AC04546]WVK80973.1 hypothetical protein KZZ52_44475 [Dactylosporangium sp. AC04546]
MDNEDTFLDTQFATYRNELLPNVTPIGPDAVRTTVRRRRRVAVTVGAAVALAIIVGPAVGYGALNGTPAPPQPGTSTEPTHGSSPSPSPSVAPSESASATAPDGRISRADLLAARLTLPPWWGDAPCRSDGQLAGAKPAQEGNWLESVDYTDVDRDGTEEAVAMIGCKFNNTVVQTQVAVFERNNAGGIVILGQVLTSRPLGWIFGVDAQPDGSIRIEVGDREPTDEQAASVVRQWRTYNWTGAKFQQTDGPTSFPPKSTLADLRVTATDIVYAALADDGSRHGTTTVTIHNTGPATAEYVWLSLELGENVRYEGNGWSSCIAASTNPGASPPNLSCLLGPMRADETRTLVLGVASPGALLTQVSARAAVVRLDKQRDPVTDARPSDNEAHFNQR